MASQLPLPLALRASLTRENFIVAPGNAQAAAFIDAWPDWPANAAVLYGPPGSGKTHLAEIWRAKSGAEIVPASTLLKKPPVASQPLIVENVDSLPESQKRDVALFGILERATPSNPALLTASTPPIAWPVTLPDLGSRFSALLSFPLWAPDDALLASIARKLFSDRQLTVPDAVIERMLTALERSPGAIRAFVDDADAKALAEGRAVTLPLVRELLAEKHPPPS